MQLCDLWHGAASAPWNMCKQPPRDAVPCQSHPGQRRRGEGTEPLRTRPSAAAVQGLYSASLERRGNSTPLPQDSWTHRVSLCLFFLWQVFPTCHGLRFLLFALNSRVLLHTGDTWAPNGASCILSAPAWLSLAVIQARAKSKIALIHAEPAVTI